jgi:hypothetical protein
VLRHAGLGPAPLTRSAACCPFDLKKIGIGPERFGLYYWRLGKARFEPGLQRPLNRKENLPMSQSETGQKSLEMRVAELEDKLSKIHISEEEMKAYHKVASLVGAHAGAAPGAQASPSLSYFCLSCYYCISCYYCTRCLTECSECIVVQPTNPGGPIGAFGKLGK